MKEIVGPLGLLLLFMTLVFGLPLVALGLEGTAMDIIVCFLVVIILMFSLAKPLTVTEALWWLHRGRLTVTTRTHRQFGNQFEVSNWFITATIHQEDDKTTVLGLYPYYMSSSLRITLVEGRLTKLGSRIRTRNISRLSSRQKQGLTEIKQILVNEIRRQYLKEK